MSVITAVINITKDGFCGHEHTMTNGELYDFYNNLLTASDAVLLGRKTYELYEGYWPVVANDRKQPRQRRTFSWLMNDMAKYVVTANKENVCWQNTILLNDVAPGTIQDIKVKTVHGLLLLGSFSVLAQLHKINAVDEYYFAVQPMAVNGGLRLLDSDIETMMRYCKLTSIKYLECGTEIRHYKR